MPTSPGATQSGLRRSPSASPATPSDPAWSRGGGSYSAPAARWASGWALLREGDLSYIDYHARHAHELYDLRRDPYQMRAIPESASGRSATERRRAQHQLDELRRSGGERLRALET